MAITVLYGPEPYVLDAKRKELLGGGETRCQKFGAEAVDALWQQSFFGSPKVWLELDGLKSLNKDFFGYVENPNPEATLVVTLTSIDKRLTVWKELRKTKGIEMVECKKLADKELRKWVLDYMEKNGLKVEQIDEICSRLYYGDEDASLFTVKNGLDALIAGAEDGVVSKELLDLVMPLRAEADRFGVAKMVDRREAGKIFAALPMLMEEVGGIALLSILLREVRVAFKALYLTEAESGARSYNFRAWGGRDLSDAMNVLSKAIRTLKSSDLPEETVVRMALMDLLRKGGAYV